MPNITAELLSGRTLDQRREFAEAVTAAVGILKARSESVRIRFDEIERERMSIDGTLMRQRESTTAERRPVP
jgi:4-oxalocrotonate tautomerase